MSTSPVNEQNLSNDEQGFQALADFFPGLMWLANPDGWIYWYNERWYEYTGRTAEEMEGWGWQAVHDPDELPKVLIQWQESIDTGQPFEMVFPLKAVDHSFRPFLTRAFPIRDSAGNILRWCGTNTDISEQVFAERQAKVTEERLRLAVDGTRDAIWDYNLESRYAYWNDRFFEILGYKPDEIAQPGFEFIKTIMHVDDVDHVSAKFNQSIADQTPYEAEYRIRHKEGHYLTVVARGKPILNDAGQVYRIAGSLTDVSERKRIDEALQESEKRYRSVVDSNLIGVIISDLESRTIVEANDAFLEMVGYSRDEFEDQGLNWDELTPDEFKPLNQKALQTILTHGQTEAFEKQYYRKDRSRVDVLLGGALQYGTRNRSITFVLDITNRKVAEQALRESETRFRSMADSAPLFIWMSGPDGQTNYVNKTWTDFLGMTANDVIHYGMGQAMLAEERRETVAVYRKAYAAREPYTIECQFKNANGELRWLLSKGAPLFFPDGSLAGYMGTSVDITDRKKAEEKLQQILEREQLIRRVVEIIGQSFDIDTILKTVAEAIGEFLQLDRCAVNRFSMTDGELDLNMSAQYVRPGCVPVDQDDINIIINAVRHLSPEAMTEGKEQIINISDQAEYIAHLKTSMERFPEGLPGLSTDKLIDIILKYEVQASLRVNIYYRGLPYGSISLSQCTYNRKWLPEEVELVKTIAEYLGSAIYQAELYQKAHETAERELHARQKLELYAKRLEASNRELEQFATIASHDLQEPLRKIKVFSEILITMVPDKGQDYLRRMNAAASRMQTLMDDLLTLSRVNRKGKPFEKVNLNKLVQTVLDDLQITIKETETVILVSSLDFVQGDETQIRQLFQNILMNGIKYRQENQAPVIKISGERTYPYYCVTIEDNGIGIRQEHYARIFEPFQRLHGVSKYPGTGMGLTICKKIVDRHGGSLWVESQPSSGSRFSFTLSMHQ